MARNAIDMKKSALCAALSTALLAPAAVAQSPLDERRADRFEYEVLLEAEYSDNRARTEPAADDGITLHPRLNFLFDHLGERLDARAIGQIGYFHRIDSEFDNDLFAEMAAQADWWLLPQRLYWTFQNYSFVEPIDIRAAPNADNRQQLNTFVTGPSVVLSPGGLWNGVLDGRYSRTNAEHTDSVDNDRFSLAARLAYTPETYRSLSIGAEASEVDYLDAPGVFDYERLDATVQFSNYLRRLAIEATAGHSRIDFDQGEDLSGPLLRLWMRWMLSPQQALIARLGREFSDASDDLVEGIDGFTTLREERGNPAVGPELYERDSVQLQWQGEFTRSDWLLTTYVRDYDYPLETEPLSHEARGVQLRGRYALGPSTYLRGEVGSERRDFDVAREDRDRYLAVSVERELNQRWAVRAGLVRFERDSTLPTGNNYDENIVSVAFVFKGGR